MQIIKARTISLLLSVLLISTRIKYSEQISRNQLHRYEKNLVRFEHFINDDPTITRKRRNLGSKKSGSKKNYSSISISSISSRKGKVKFTHYDDDEFTKWSSMSYQQKHHRPGKHPSASSSSSSSSSSQKETPTIKNNNIDDKITSGDVVPNNNNSDNSITKSPSITKINDSKKESPTTIKIPPSKAPIIESNPSPVIITTEISTDDIEPPTSGAIYNNKEEEPTKTPSRKDQILIASSSMPIKSIEIIADTPTTTTTEGLVDMEPKKTTHYPSLLRSTNAPTKDESFTTSSIPTNTPTITKTDVKLTEVPTFLPTPTVIKAPPKTSSPTLKKGTFDNEGSDTKSPTKVNVSTDEPTSLETTINPTKIDVEAEGISSRFPSSSSSSNSPTKQKQELSTNIDKPSLMQTSSSTVPTTTDKPSPATSDVQAAPVQVMSPNIQITYSGTIDSNQTVTYGDGTTIAPLLPNLSCSNPQDRDEIIQSRISPHISSIDDFYSSFSPQSKALTWLLTIDTSISACSPSLIERYILIVFYFSTNGIGWNDNTNWLTDADYCSWYGISCSNGFLDSMYRIEGIYLGMNKLRGIIPEELSSLQNLLSLSLFSNKITGTLSSKLLTFSNIQSIDIYDNKITGALPDTLYNMISLQSLHLANNEISGNLSYYIGNLKNLTEFTLSNNNIDGELPDEIGELVNLEYLILYSNKISGNIPSTIHTLQKLHWIDLSSNKISSFIPESFYKLKNLINIYLSENYITGTISSTINNLGNVRQLFLNDNLISGLIPSTIGALNILETLLLDNNKFNGLLPMQSIGQLQQMQFLDVSTNSLNGSIFEDASSMYLSNLTRLKYAYFSNNTFDGTISSSIITDLKSLKHLWMNNNTFVGTFPNVPRGSWLDLEELLVHDNNITGTISNSVCVLPSLESLWADCLYPPEVVCTCCTHCV